jgi:hypothetical protein
MVCILGSSIFLLLNIKHKIFTVLCEFMQQRYAQQFCINSGKVLDGAECICCPDALQKGIQVKINDIFEKLYKKTDHTFLLLYLSFKNMCLSPILLMGDKISKINIKSMTKFQMIKWYY